MLKIRPAELPSSSSYFVEPFCCSNSPPIRYPKYGASSKRGSWPSARATPVARRRVAATGRYAAARAETRVRGGWFTGVVSLLEPAVDLHHVGFAQAAGCLLQRDHREQVVVARLRVARLGEAQAVLRGEHVDGRLRADFEAGLGRAQRGAVRLDGLLERAHARDVGQHREVRVARLALRLARDPLERLL